MSKTLKRDLIAVIWTLLVTYAIGKWAFHLAYIERGYEAVGGEYLLIPVVYWGAWKAINYLFDSLEELENERNCRKKEVEELLGCEITDEQFEEALKYVFKSSIFAPVSFAKRSNAVLLINITSVDFATGKIESLS